MPNGTETLSIYSENDIETYRDVLYYVAQVLGGFCVINREGKLVIRKYSADSGLTVEQKHRFSSSFSDFVNPLLQFGLEETREALCTNILNDLSVVNYVPFDSDTIGNPVLDLGDVLTFKGGQADGTKLACITSMTIKIGGRQSLKCVGKNPRLAQAKSKNDKNIAGLLNQIEDTKSAGKIGIHTFTNASAYTLADTDVRVISMRSVRFW